MAKTMQEILKGLLEAKYVSVFKGETREEWKERMVHEAMAAMPLQPFTALKRIREAGHNFGAWATWAQKTAAWGMEPYKWPDPGKDAPPEEVPKGVIMPLLLSQEMSKAGAKANSEWLNDNAPIGEARYELPMTSIYKAFIDHKGE